MVGERLISIWLLICQQKLNEDKIKPTKFTLIIASAVVPKTSFKSFNKPLQCKCSAVNNLKIASFLCLDSPIDSVFVLTKIFDFRKNVSQTCGLPIYSIKCIRTTT